MSQDIVPLNPDRRPGGSDQFLPVMTVREAVERHRLVAQFASEVMTDGTDYGVIPGTNNKKVLLKPGAEKLCTLFGLCVEAPEIVREVEDWSGSLSGGEPFFHYLVRQDLTRNGRVVASQLGSCNSREAKYRWRSGDRKCPECGQPTIIKGKKEFDKTGGDGGWLCFRKKGGCGLTFRDDDRSITEQSTARVPNPDIADTVNTILKMAQKRALLSAVLLATNASEFFTVDLEDGGHPKGEARGEARGESRGNGGNGNGGSAPKPAPRPQPRPQPAKAAAQSPAQAAPPKTAQEFLDRLRGFEAGLVKEGTCEGGQLVDAVDHKLQTMGLPEAVKWTEAHLKIASQVARSVIEEMRAAKAARERDGHKGPPDRGSPPETDAFDAPTDTEDIPY